MGVASKDASDGSEGSEGKEGGSDRVAMPEIKAEERVFVNFSQSDLIHLEVGKPRPAPFQVFHF